ncbi:MAG: phosphopyruvate hydratase [SAR116 cluster bacterium]|nr:phosphopyruvate hydratase [SAR116 cluster bacterium]
MKEIFGRQILDSRGNPTVEVEIILNNGIKSRASVPSGASTGVHEAIEKRDHDNSKYLGKGVSTVINNINFEINNNLRGLLPFDQEKIDQKLIELDGTKNKSRLGANALLGVSLAIARVSAKAKNESLYKYLSNSKDFLLPTPLMNFINGGAHANNSLDFQEIMIMPVGAKSFSEALRWGAEIFHHLKKILSDKLYSTSVGDEGGFSPQIKSVDEALELLSKAVENSGRNLDNDIKFAIDAASSEFFSNNYYQMQNGEKKLDTSDMINMWENLVQKYPIISLEDPLDENDYDGYKELTNLIGKNVQIVGDDLFATNINRLNEGIKINAANSILIKLNQIGTLTETIKTVKLAKQSKFGTIISHRSGETEDTFIADFSVGLNAGQIKTGSLSRSERLCKYNQLLRIEEELGAKAKYNGNKILF